MPPVFKSIWIIVLIFIIFHCSRDTDDYYSTVEANQKILLSFLLKDSVCGTSHNLTGFLPGNARKEEVNACLKAISLVGCSDWAQADPSPLLCKGIHIKTR